MAELEKKGFDKFVNDAKVKKSRLSGKITKADDDEDGDDNQEDSGKKGKIENGYNYLLSMPIWSLTMERVRRSYRCLRSHRTDGALFPGGEAD